MLDIEFVEDDRRAVFGEGFDELAFGGFDVGDQPFGYSLVVEGVFDVIRRCRARVVKAHLDIECDDLADAAFPVIDANDGFDAQVFDENNIHGLSDPMLAVQMQGGGQASADRDSRSQRGNTLICASLCWPALSRIEPARAIMAPLSVQNSRRGK